MKTIRHVIVLVILGWGVQACNLPAREIPFETSESPSSPSPSTPSLTPSPRPPTSTPEPQVWFTDVQEGDSLIASVHPVSALPMVTTGIGFTNTERPGRASHYLTLDADGMNVFRVRLINLADITGTTFTWTAWHGNGQYQLNLSKVNHKGKVLSQQSIQVSVTGIPEDLPNVEDRFRSAYQEYLGLNIPFPAIVHYTVETPEDTKSNMWTSAVYIHDKLYKVYFYDESDVIGTNMQDLETGEHNICRPRGAYKVLAVIVDYGNTSIKQEYVTEKLIAAGQAANQRWADYSDSIGLAEPILQIETTIAYLGAPPVLGELVTAAQVRDLTGYDPSDFDILAEVDLDLAMRVPREYGGGGVAFMGACKPEGAQAVNMIVGISSRDNVTDMAAALFDHEMIHLFGWVHTWPDGDGSGPAQLNEGHWFPYKLMGWTDINGDGIIEILSDQPYGFQP